MENSSTENTKPIFHGGKTSFRHKILEERRFIRRKTKKKKSHVEMVERVSTNSSYVGFGNNWSGLILHLKNLN